MSIPLNNPTATESGPPGVGFAGPDSGLTIGLVKFDDYVQHDIDTNEPKTFANGDPMTGVAITGIVHAVKGCEVGPKDDKTELTVGETVRIFVEGPKYYAWRDASQAAGKAEHRFAVGDLIWFGCTGTTPTANPAHSDRKDYAAKVGKPGAEHAGLVAACEAAYRAANAIPVDAPPVGAPPVPSSGGAWSDNQAPF